MLQADLVITLGHLFAHRHALDHGALGRHAELLEQFLLDINAACAIRIGHRFGFAQHGLQLGVCIDHRFGRTFLHHQANPRVGQLHAGRGIDFALFDQLIQGIADHDHHIGLFATGQAVGNRFRRLAHGRAKDGVEGVTALLGVLRAEQFIRGGEAARGHDLELFGLG